MTSADFLERYKTVSSLLPGYASERASAARALAAAGLPWETPRHRSEAWKYTNLRPLLTARFGEPPVDVQNCPSAFALPLVPRILFANGRPLNDAHGFASLEFGKLARPDRDPFVALNTMLATSGVSIHVPPGVDGGVVQIIQLSSGNTDIHLRNRIKLEEGARLTLVEASSGEGEYLLNSVTEVDIASGGKLSHIRLQADAHTAYHVSTSYAEVAANATYDLFALNVGARLGRTEANVCLADKGAEAYLHGVQLLAGSQHGDFTTFVDHHAEGGTSRQVVRNVLSERSRGVFQGKIRVAPNAQQTDGYQMSRTLLLGSDAEINTKPELEIYADDVKCGHGATVGALDSEQIFYLRSRGISESDARSILIHAFLADALDVVLDETIRAWLQEFVQQWWKECAA